ncbi:protein LOWER TEMPERATURE 1 [Curcuma longa]|uniref:protein LOWER TEMPERATURE 1 n=1 Tax=Curcuma longa TaxID=136217 RepID=UPI003D9DE3D4
MEAKFSSPPRSNGGTTQAAGGASKHLVGLPSRGFFSSPVLSSNPGTMRVYVCERETAPPEDQLIKTNTTNILIRALQINKQKSELKDVTAKSSTDGCNGKRSVRTTEGKAPPKKIKGSSSTEFSEHTFQTMSVERLRSLLKERGLSPKGRKDELIARLKDES